MNERAVSLLHRILHFSHRSDVNLRLLIVELRREVEATAVSLNNFMMCKDKHCCVFRVLKIVCMPQSSAALIVSSNTVSCVERLQCNSHYLLKFVTC